jgi:hypothetical protein
MHKSHYNVPSKTPLAAQPYVPATVARAKPTLHAKQPLAPFSIRKHLSRFSVVLLSFVVFCVLASVASYVFR